MKLIIALPVLALIFSIGCSSSIDNEEMGSELKWGHLPSSMGMNNWLTQVKPEDEIEICGNETEYLKKAVRRWGDVVGRGKYLRIVDCGKGTKVKTKITLTTNHSGYPCNAQPGVQGATDPGSGTMYTCTGLVAPLKYVIVHETGHMWGMCDMYPGGEQMCDAKNKTQIDNTAIMGNGSIKDDPELTKDDKDGITAMINRSEFAAVKKAWDDYLATNPTPQDPNGGGTGNSTPTPPTSGDSTPAPTTPAGTGAEIYVGLPRVDVDGKLSIWIAANVNVTRVELCRGDKITCTSPGAKVVAREYVTAQPKTADRVFYKTSVPVEMDRYVGKLTLLGYDSTTKLIQVSTVDIAEK